MPIDSVTLALRSSSRSLRLLPSADRSGGRLRIAMLAPPWIPVPAPGYGGIEAVIDLLSRALRLAL
jgi:hypothetical protein